LGFAASRFSDPRTRPPSHFAVYHVGKGVEVASLATIVRDLRRGNPGPLLLSARDRTTMPISTSPLEHA
jgi:hypothetical protein